MGGGGGREAGLPGVGGELLFSKAGVSAHTKRQEQKAKAIGGGGAVRESYQFS